MCRLDPYHAAELAKAGRKNAQLSLLSHVQKLEPESPGALAQLQLAIGHCMERLEQCAADSAGVPGHG